MHNAENIPNDDEQLLLLAAAAAASVVYCYRNCNTLTKSIMWNTLECLLYLLLLLLLLGRIAVLHVRRCGLFLLTE